MIRRLGGCAILMIALWGCKGPKLVPTNGELPAMSEKQVIEQLNARPEDERFFRMTAVANYSDSETSQNFRVDARIIRDSIVWLDAMDPILGLKVARLVVFPDSVIFINRMERTYLAGNIPDLQKKFGIPLDFDILQGALMAQPFRRIDSKNGVDVTATDYYHISYRPVMDSLDPGPSMFYYFKLGLPGVSLLTQSISDGMLTLEARYLNFTEVNGLLKPSYMEWLVIPANEQILRLDKINYSIGERPGTPVSIPDNYDRVDP